MELSKELQTIKLCVLEAAKILENAEDNLGIEAKSSDKDLVTMYDKAIQKKLYELLLREFPNAGFLGEEDGLNKTEGVNGVFIIDPIDGTTNFIKGLGHSAISVGYVTGNEIKRAVVYNPFRKELYEAEAGKGAYLNGKQIHVSDCKMEQALGLYGTAPYNAALRSKSFRLAEEMVKAAIDARRMGAASLDLCYVACGRAEFYVEFMLSPWDYAGGALIAKEAGAIVTETDGKPLQFTNKAPIIAANKETYDLVLAMIAGLE